MDMVKQGYKQTEVGVIPEDWEVKELGELTILMTNGFVGVAKLHYTENDEGVTYIQGFNVEENSFNYTGIKKVTRSFHLSHLRSSLKYKDLLTVQTGDVGLTTIVPKSLEGANCHALIISRFVTGKVESKYISYYLNSNQGRNRLKEIETGTTMKHINVGDFQFFQIPLPPLPEQEAIAAALSDADAWIENLEQLIAKKRLIKQGAMQTLLTPKDDWEVKKLGEVVEIKRGQIITSSVRVDGDVPVIAGGRTPAYFHNVSNRKGKTITISASGASAGYVGFHNYPIFASDCSTISESDKYVIEFIYYFLVRNQDLIYSFQTGGAQPHIHAKDVEPMIIGIPSLSEQERIARILSDIDAELEALEQQLAKARQIKQGMMQELLTGRIRLV